MEILDPGHRYLLNCISSQKNELCIKRERLNFVKREGDDYPGNIGSYDGTTCQEVMRVLIDRCLYVNKQKWNIQTYIAIRLLILCIYLFEQRHLWKKHKRLLKPWELNSRVNIIDGHLLLKESYEYNRRDIGQDSKRLEVK